MSAVGLLALPSDLHWSLICVTWCQWILTCELVPSSRPFYSSVRCVFPGRPEGNPGFPAIVCSYCNMTAQLLMSLLIFPLMSPFFLGFIELCHDPLQ